MRSLRVEFTRLRWRRAVIILLVTCVAVPALILAAVAWGTRPVSAEEQQQAEAQVAQERESPQYQREVERCAKHPDRYGDPNATAEQCVDIVGPQVEWYVSRSPLDPKGESEGSLVSVIVLVTALVMLVGTTFAGADWNSGSMSNQLLFEPRRLRVWWAKAVAVFLATLAASAAVVAGYWGALVLLAKSRDIATPAKVMDAVIGIGGRGALLAAVGALGAYALTMLFRSTVATLGIMFAVLVAGSYLIAVLPFDSSGRWALYNNVGAVLYDGITYFQEPPASCGAEIQTGNPSALCSGERTLTLWAGVRYLGALLAGAVALSLWSFRRRDIP
jgi:hypothetical protein